VVIARGVTLVPGAHETNNDALKAEGTEKKDVFSKGNFAHPGNA
jgi:hypothetical protein